MKVNMRQMKLLAPAKVNLFLNVVGKRPDGYHDLLSLMSCVSLYDVLTVTFGPPYSSVVCSHKDVPEDDTNLAAKAAALFLRRLGKKVHLKIKIDKSIPVAAGLGGGSSDAAAMLTGMNSNLNFPFSKSQLMSMAEELGADVPFFIISKPCIAQGIGYKLKVCNNLDPMSVVLVNPGFEVSTAEVYRKFKLSLTKCKKVYNLSTFADREFNVLEDLCNDLETITINDFPEIETVKEELLKQGAAGALMSGSGPTVFGLFFKRAEAKKAFNELSKKEGWKTYLAELLV